MKRFFKVRLLPLCLLLVMLLQSLPVLARGETVYRLGMRSASESETYGTISPNFADSHLYYDQLETEAQRALYNALTEAKPGDPVILLEVTDIPTIIVPPEGATMAFEAEIMAYVESQALPAYAAATMDNPLLFWASGVKYGANVSIWGNTVSSITIQCIPDATGYFDRAGYEDTLEILEDLYESLEIPEDGTVCDQLKFFHDYLCDTVVYIESAHSHNVIGPLLYGKSVCEGYAKSFKLFCRVMDIPCMTVTGVGYGSNGAEGHAWNAVRMEDGNWYAVDVTWDDQVSGIYYDFFLVGGESVPENFQKLPFNQSHVAMGDFFGHGEVVLATPPLHPTAYNPESVHVHAYTEEVFFPTCTEEGYTLYTCACGDSYKDHYTKPVGHDYTDWAVEVPATCHGSGILARECRVCGLEDKIFSTPAGAVYEAVVTPPTCTEMGFTTYYCTTCDEFYVDDYTAPTGHSYDTVITPPTCEEPGFITYTCHCGDSHAEKAEEPLGHDWNVELVPPTCTEDGFTAFTCNRCEEQTVEVYPAAGHSYTATVTPPTCEEDGYTTYTCPCGDSYVEEIVPATGHVWEDTGIIPPGCEGNGWTTYVCTLCGKAETVKKEPDYDIDGNGVVEESDVKDLLSILVGNSPSETMPDLDFDGKLTIYDCVLLMQQIQ